MTNALSLADSVTQERSGWKHEMIVGMGKEGIEMSSMMVSLFLPVMSRMWDIIKHASPSLGI